MGRSAEVSAGSGNAAFPQDASRLGGRRLLRGGIIAAVLAVVANLVVYAVARGLFDVSFVMRYEGPDASPGRLPVGWVVVVSVVAAVVATALVWVLGRVSSRALTVFRIVAAVVLVASLGGPLTVEDASTSTRVALGVMHVVTAAAIVGALTSNRRGIA